MFSMHSKGAMKMFAIMEHFKPAPLPCPVVIFDNSLSPLTGTPHSHSIYIHWVTLQPLCSHLCNK